MKKTLTLLTTLIFSSFAFASDGSLGSAPVINIRGVTSISNIPDDETINAGATEYIIFLSMCTQSVGLLSQQSQLCTELYNTIYTQGNNFKYVDGNFP